jgi:hypothetical protein
VGGGAGPSTYVHTASPNRQHCSEHKGARMGRRSRTRTALRCLSAIEDRGCLLDASSNGFATTTELVGIGGLLRVTQRCRDPVAGSLTSIKER